MKSNEIVTDETTINGESEEDSPLLNSESTEEEEQATGTVIGSIFNLTNTIVGGGILAFPYAYYSTGIVSGIITILIFVALSGSTLHVIFYCARYCEVKVRSYQELINIYFGKYMMKVCEIVLLLYLSGACIVYLCVIGDSLVPFMQFFFGDDIIFGKRKYIIITFSCVFVFPITLLRKVDALKWTSILSILNVSYLVVMVIITGIIQVSTVGFPTGVKEGIFLNVNRYNNVIPQFFMALPIFAFAFNCHVITIPIYNELKNPTMRRLDTVVIFTLIIVVVGYTLTGIFGFFNFGDATPADILVGYKGDVILALIGRAVMGIVSMFSYPMLNYTQRLSIKTLFFKGSEMNTVVFIMLSIIIFVINLAISLFVPDISVVFGFVASVLGVVIIFVFPALILAKVLFMKRKKRKEKKIIYDILFILPVFYVIIALFMIICGPLTTIYRLIYGDEGF